MTFKVIQKELVTPSGRAVRFVYNNWRGEIALRRAKPITVFWGSNKWHPEDQWLMYAFDQDKREHRTFALAGVQPWDPVHDPQPYMVVFKDNRDTERHAVGQSYNLCRRVLAVKEIDPDSNDITVELDGGRKRVFYVTGHEVKASCWIESWVRWAKTADRAWWDGERDTDPAESWL